VQSPREQIQYIASCVGVRVTAETLLATYDQVSKWCTGEPIPIVESRRVRTAWLILKRVNANAATPEVRRWFTAPQARLAGRSLSGVVGVTVNEAQRRTVFAAAGMGMDIAA
jgi:hypothetical protein